MVRRRSGGTGSGANLTPDRPEGEAAAPGRRWRPTQHDVGHRAPERRGLSGVLEVKALDAVALGLVTWWFVAGVIAWFLVACLGRPAQVAVVLLGWVAGVLQVRRERSAPGSPSAPGTHAGPAPHVVDDIPRRRDGHPSLLGADAAPEPDQPSWSHPDPDKLRELERRAAALRALVDPGVEVVILLAHQAELVGVRRSCLGFDLELDAQQASYVLRSGEGDIVRTKTGGRQAMSVLVPARLLDSPDGLRFVPTVEAWHASGALVDVEWEVEIHGAILFVQVRNGDDVVQLGMAG